MSAPYAAGLRRSTPPDELHASLRQAFGGIGPWMRHRPRGLVVPRRAFGERARAAARAYATLRASRPETIVLVGPDRAEEGLRARGDGWETPLGPLDLDEALLDALLAAGPLEHVSEGDPDLEAHFPFLRYLWDDPPRVVCVTIGVQDAPSALTLARALVAAIKNEPRDVVLVASSDLARAEGAAPGAEAAARGKAESILAALTTFDAASIIEAARRSRAGACGQEALAAVAQAAGDLGASRVEPLAWGAGRGPDGPSTAYASLAMES